MNRLIRSACAIAAEAIGREHADNVAAEAKTGDGICDYWIVGDKTDDGRRTSHA